MHTDTLIIGCGIAGATTALRLADDRERRIVLITAESAASESNSSYAQGGIVGLGEDDSPELLVGDVIQAGAGLSYEPAVRILAEEGPDRLREILVEEVGLRFDRDRGGKLLYGLEAAHSRRRILHVGDATGGAIMEALLARLAERPNVELRTAMTAVDLLTFPHHAVDPLAVYEPQGCHGAYVLDQSSGGVRPILARHTVLATGGLGQIFLNTSNPAGARGDGLAMAYRAGARVANTEYIQFHPTTLHMPGTTKFLISEAVRGEGGVLLTPKGEPFMERYAAKWKDLATRDVVARAIYWEMLANDYPYMLLDIASHASPKRIRERFPAIHARCLECNVDIASQPIPVVPAAHYSCGGVLVDLHGRTSLPGLYAVGEVACTGVHGANRLASTSLLEGLVWGARAAYAIAGDTSGRSVSDSAAPPWDDAGLTFDADPALIQGDMQTIRNLMWHYVGLVRNAYRLDRAIRELRHLWLNVEDFYKKARLTDGLIGLRNAVQSATIVGRAALHNPTSRGCHYRQDSRENRDATPPPEAQRLEPDGR
jgi:L-aspartate oxidase